jgi:hypothetical protein
MIKNAKAYLVAVDMGYGHERAAYPLQNFAVWPENWPKQENNIIISANNYPGMPIYDRESWLQTQKVYETISKWRRFPILGPLLFGIMNYIQKIDNFYPRRDLSKPSIQVKQLYQMIKKGLGRHLIEELNKEPLPFIATFFMPAFFAEEYGYKGDIFCLCTDTDISRAWVPLHPKTSRIIYLAPTNRVKERLILYGIRPENIHLTGFPLPQKLVGESGEFLTAKESLRRRLRVLDPKGIFKEEFKSLIAEYNLESDENGSSTVTLTFAIGGAGAQTEIVASMIESIKSLVLQGRIKLNLVAGTSSSVKQILEKIIVDANLSSELSSGKISILYEKHKISYFESFSGLLKETDILWTKPSEMSFYTALGLPLIMSDPLGSQEEFNRHYLLDLGVAVDQGDPKLVSEWLPDLLNSGFLAEAAINGFIQITKNGAKNIEKVISGAPISSQEEKFIL